MKSMNNRNLTDIAETTFEILSSRQAINDALKEKKSNQSNEDLSLRDLILLIQNEAAEKTTTWWDIVNNSTKLQSDLDILLEKFGAEKNLNVAAAATEEQELIRYFEKFTLLIKKSNRGDGSAFLIIKFISKDEKLKTVKSLFVKSEGKYQFLSLPKPSNGSIQLLLRPNHPIMKAAENINTEFYLK